MFRALTLGTPRDTNNNSFDFVFGDTNGTFVSGLGQLLAAPGPENLDGPIQRNAAMPGFLIDQTTTSNVYPNRERDLTSDPVNNSTFGTMTIRRRVVNNTGQPVIKLRFRIINMTTFPPSGSLADVRARSVGDTVVSINDTTTCTAASLSAPCAVTARGTTLETPPAQPNGGGIDSSLNVGFITLNAPLANGASVDVQFLLGIQTTGTFRFFVNVEALP